MHTLCVIGILVSSLSARSIAILRPPDEPEAEPGYYDEDDEYHPYTEPQEEPEYRMPICLRIGNYLNGEQINCIEYRRIRLGNKWVAIGDCIIF